MGLIILHLALRTDTPQLEGRETAGREGRRRGGREHEKRVHEKPSKLLFRVKNHFNFSKAKSYPQVKDMT